MTEKEIEQLKEAFGRNLQKIRKSKKLSLLKLSYACTIDSSNISKIEHGKFNITLATIVELAIALEVAPKRLMEFEIIPN